MIKTVGELLQALVDSATLKLKEYPSVEHPGIIGDIYEGLAREVANRALLPVAKLRVVRGKIRNSKGALSKQIDCMIVDGDGEQVPYTDHWIYDLRQVVALVEVKKTLYADDLSSGVDLMVDLWQRIAEPRAIPNNLLRDAWRAIHGTDLPSKKTLAQLGPAEQVLYHALVVEASLPVRVVLGFEGYKSEAALRAGLTNLLEARVASAGTKGAPLGPIALPNLILGPGGSLIKLAGMPGPGPFSAAEQTWSFYASSGGRPIEALLEHIWTRLNYYYGAPPWIFGEDLDLDPVNLLYVARYTESQGKQGWNIDAIPATEKELEAHRTPRPWTPAVLSKAAFVIVTVLCKGEEVSLSDSGLVSLLASEGCTVDEVVSELQTARLAYRRGDSIRLLTDRCQTAIVPDLGYVAGEDKSGRMTRWLLKSMKPKNPAG